MNILNIYIYTQYVYVCRQYMYRLYVSIYMCVCVSDVMEMGNRLH